jgi:hypothetical protein
MKKVFFIAIVILLFLMLNVTLNETFYKKYTIANVSVHGKNLIIDRNDQIFDIVNVGSSHGEYAFDYSVIKTDRGLNLAMSSQSFYYDDLMLKSYERHFNNNTIIVITVSYFSFCYSYDEGDSRYVNFIEKSKLNITLENYLFTKYLPLIGINGSKQFISAIQSNFILESEPLHNHNNLEDFYNESEVTYERHNRLMQCTDDQNKDQIEILSNLISYHKNKGRHVLLISTPKYKTYNDQFENADKFRYFQNIDFITRKFDISYYDYSKDERFSEEYDFFMDDDHLNTIGAQNFTKIVYNEVLSEVN